MNREIKFRVWDKEMIDWEDIKSMSINNPTTHNLGHMFNKKELMQYTNLKDKNDVEIYEGDIVKCVLGKYSEEYLYKEAFLYGQDGKHVIREISIPEVYQERFPDGMEVIGNIYENPELLEEKDD